ncbi:ataxin-2-like protein [Gadus chalcogrammus]|uniref:ataxin-2-like protein n=1 Tax=Gadus chalcogrammus TaxID=1042646 RepID=UPI0024C282CF|nr:ataxin-2-like protein [Gadus chalcogrammus]
MKPGNTGMHMTKKTRNTMKPPSQSQSSPVFEGVYNNAGMLHILTSVVGATCDVRVKNGAVYEGIFKTLSSQCELAVDAVHKRGEGGPVDDGGGGGDGGGGPRIEDITDTMIFSPSDLVTMTCRNVDLSFAIRDAFTDSAISSGRVNGEQREKVLLRWDGGDPNGEGLDLDTDSSNGWDANEMFKFNEETYGIKSTYDSNLSMYTVPLERGSSDSFRQREARAARLANEIEGSAQYRRRVSLENDEGKSEEDKFSAVAREREGRASPGFSAVTREGRYIPLPQRAREMGVSPSSLRGGAPARPGGPASSRHPAPNSASPKPTTDRSSPLSVRTAYSPHQSQASPPAAGSPPCSNHAPPPFAGDAPRASLNGVVSRTSPKAQRQATNRHLRNTQPPVSRSPKPDAQPQEFPVADSSHPSVTMPTAKPSGPTPLFPVDVNEILNSAANDRPDGSPQDPKTNKVQQRSQLEELRKFGKEFRLQPSSSPSGGPASATAPAQAPDSAPSPLAHPSSSSPQVLQQSPGMLAPTSGLAAGHLGSTPGGPQAPAGTPGEEALLEGREAGVPAVQVKSSTLNPNAKEFQPVKISPAAVPLQKPSPTPTPPRPSAPSPSVVMPPPGQHPVYSGGPGHYLSYLSPIPLQGPAVQAPQMYQYTMSTVNQNKYPRPKGPMLGSRPDQHGSMGSPVLHAGPSLVASPYPQSYLQYALPPHYPGQPMYSVLPGGARMLTSGAPPQAMGPAGPQYPGQAEASQGQQQAMYAAQSFSGPLHHPQPSSTPTGSQPPPQHAAPSPAHSQSGQGAPQPHALYHTGQLSAAPGHSSPQASFSMQGYSLPPHQSLNHSFTQISQLAQAHVAGGMSGHHHHPQGGHGPPPVMLHYGPPQHAASPAPQHPNTPHQQAAHQHFYMGAHPAVQVQGHPPQQLSFHPAGN